MPQGRSGISTATAPNMVLDAGEVWFNIGITELEGLSPDPVAAALGVSGAVKVGGTRGGSTFNPGRTLREMPIDGAIGPVKGFVRRQASRPVLTVNLVEVTPENLERAIAASNVATVNSFAKVTGGEVEDADFITNVALLATVKGSDLPIVIVVQNALVHEAPEFSFADEDETVLSVAFVGHVLASAPNTEAFAIYHPGAVVP